MDKDALIGNRARATEAVGIPGVGVVTVGALSRKQHLEIAGVVARKHAGDPVVYDRMRLAAACVDPVLTEQEAEAWMAAAPAGEIAVVLDVVGRLSGTDIEAKEIMKEAMRQFREGA